MSNAPDLAALRAQAEAAKVARANRASKRNEASEVVQLTNEVKLAELEAEHGDLNVDIAAVNLKHTGQMVVVRKPSPAVFQRFTSRVLKGLQPADYWDFVKGCLIFPTPAEFSTLSDTSPGLILACANACSRLAEAEISDAEGK